METSQVAERIKAKFGETGIEFRAETADPYVVVPAEKIVEICRFLKEDPEIHLDALSSISGVDWPEESLIDVVYHLASYRYHNVCALKVRLQRDNPDVPTVEGVWRAANWFEREIYDLFGVRFRGHSNLKRLLLPDDWVGHPLRKDYQEEPEYRGMKTTREDPMKAMAPAPWGAAPVKPEEPESEKDKDGKPEES